MKSPPGSLLDASAIGLSGLCLAHCLLLPATAALLPALPAAAGAEWLHLLLVAIALPLAAVALARAHRQRPLPVGLWWLAAAGLSGLLAGAIGWPTPALETPSTVVGGVLLATAHGWNWRRRPHPACG
ncbi:MerC family mercury resistance protein [Luteimonas saliphila]|uniref:MerC family mercury resistance protein n=1 Tax=Luteimonas saliphila TaxID=2804919 RepID=UPI00192D9A9C|nr:MerC family mercury resistance protein [Luteimonas saliphila]